MRSMAKKHTPLVAANWKMHPKSVGAAKKLFLEIRNGVKKEKRPVHVMVAPPTPFLSDLQRLSPSGSIALGAQSVFHEAQGAYTGEVSVPMLKSVGATQVIVGHSERRALGDTDTEIAQDLVAALKQNMTAILCIGEQKRDSHGHHFNIVEEQLRSAVAHIPKTKVKQMVVAYEPIWAIGTGQNATGEDIEEMRLFIQKLLSDTFGRKAADAVRVLYGGSVNKKNAADILEKTSVNGFLVGGASLRAAEFVEIVKITAEHHAKA